MELNTHVAALPVPVVQRARSSTVDCRSRSHRVVIVRLGPLEGSPVTPGPTRTTPGAQPAPLRLQHPHIHCYEYRKAACKPACKPVDGAAGGGSGSALAAASSRQPGLGQMLQQWCSRHPASRCDGLR